MNYYVTYLSEPNRVIQTCLIDARATTMPANANGNAIQPIVDNITNSIGINSIPYKIETELGNLVGYFVVLNTNGTGSLQTKCIRPQFYNDSTNINNLIGGFISGNNWEEDFLF